MIPLSRVPAPEFQCAHVSQSNLGPTMEADFAGRPFKELLLLYTQNAVCEKTSASYISCHSIVAAIENRVRRNEVDDESKIEPKKLVEAVKLLVPATSIEVAACLARSLVAEIDALPIGELFTVASTYYLRWKMVPRGYPEDFGFKPLFDKMKENVNEKVAKEPHCFQSFSVAELFLFNQSLEHTKLAKMALERFECEKATVDFSKLSAPLLAQLILDLQKHIYFSKKPELFEKAVSALCEPEALRSLGAEKSLHVIHFTHEINPKVRDHFLKWCQMYASEIHTMPAVKLSVLLRLLRHSDEKTNVTQQSVISTIDDLSSEHTHSFADCVEDNLDTLVWLIGAKRAKGFLFRTNITEAIQWEKEKWEFQNVQKSISQLLDVLQVVFEDKEGSILNGPAFIRKAKSAYLGCKDSNKLALVSNSRLCSLISCFSRHLDEHDALFVELHQELLIRLKQENARASFTFDDITKCVTSLANRDTLTDETVVLLAAWLKPELKRGFDLACACCFEALAIQLLQARPDTSKLLPDKKSYLHTTVSMGSVRVVEMVLEIAQSKNENINRKDAVGMTALHYAAKANNVAIIRLLLTYGADPAVRDAQGLTFARFLTKASKIQFFKGFVHIIDALNSNDAHLNPNHFYIPAHIQAEVHINPLEVAYLLQDFGISQAILQHLTETEAHDHFLDLQKHYPASKDFIGAQLVKQACSKNRPESALKYIDEMSLQGLNHFGIIASVYKNFQLLKRLCERGVNTNYTLLTLQSKTLLHLAFAQLDFQRARILLKHGADPLRKDGTGKCPIDHLKQSGRSPNLIRKFLKELFVDFPKACEYIEEHGPDRLADALKKNPGLLAAKNGASPLEVCLILNDQELAIKAAKDMLTDDFERCVAQLKKKYPASDLNFIEFALVMLDLEHLKQNVREAIPEKPKGAELRALLDIAKEISCTKGEIKELDEKFVQVITRREVTVTPPKDSDAWKQFYRDVDNALCHTIYALKTDEAKRHFLDRITKIVGFCAGALLPTAIELYDQFVLGHPPAFEPALFEKLGDFRRALLETLVPNYPQNRHHNQMLLFALSSKKELNLPYKESAYDDRVLRDDAVDASATKTELLELYRTKLVPYIQEQLVQDGAFRSKYLDYWKASVPLEDVYNIDTGELNRDWIVEMLKRLCVISKESMDSHPRGTQATLAYARARGFTLS